MRRTRCFAVASRSMARRIGWRSRHVVLRRSAPSISVQVVVVSAVSRAGNAKAGDTGSPQVHARWPRGPR
jgi:hypothetical protein